MSSSEQNEPMIGRDNRPSQVNAETRVAELTVRQLMDLMRVQQTAGREWYKPEHKEFWKPEVFKEFWKPEAFKEYYKPEFSKPELSKPEGSVDMGGIVEQIADLVVAKLREQG